MTEIYVDRSLAIVVFLVHGVLDTILTAHVFVTTEDTSIESNPLLQPLLSRAYQQAFSNGDDTLHIWNYLWDFVFFKMGFVALAVGLLIVTRPYIPHWRKFTISLALAGIGVIINNFLAISGGLA